MILDTAHEFLTRCFCPTETIAILLRREVPAALMQRIVRLEQAIAPRYLRWLAHENASGANVYVSANPLRPGTRKRIKESIASVRHLYLDIDIDGDTRLSALRQSTSVPRPTAAIKTSPGKYQVFWRVEGFDLITQEQMLRALAIRFGGDPACTDCNRVIRVPGFQNWKYTPSFLVSVSYGDDSIYSLQHFEFDKDLHADGLARPGFARSRKSTKHSQSEQDWAWALAELAAGRDELELTEALALRRSDKPNPAYYAQRTVDLAAARLALLAGSSFEQVIADIEARRRPSHPDAIRTGRAREIAHTATRMIARLHTA